MSKPLLKKLKYVESTREIKLKGESETIRLYQVSHIAVSDSSIYLKHRMGQKPLYAIFNKSEIVWMLINTEKLSTHYEES